MFTNPDATMIPIYTVEVTYANGSHEFYRNVVEFQMLGDRLLLEVLAHGVRKITLNSVTDFDRTLQPTLEIDEDD